MFIWTILRCYLCRSHLEEVEKESSMRLGLVGVRLEVFVILLDRPLHFPGFSDSEGFAH